MTVPKAKQIASNQIVMELPNYSVFQSYDSIIAIKYDDKSIVLGPNWDYSRTTSKYRNQFLGMTTQQIKDEIAEGHITIDPTL